MKFVLRLTFLMALGGVTACNTAQPFNIGGTLFARKAEVVEPICAAGDSVCTNVITASADTMRPQYRDGGGGPMPGAVALTSFDTATEAEIAAATASAGTVGERKLGTTVASLGDVSKAGFWLDTSLVTKVSPGRVVWADNGNSVAVELRPLPGGASGSQISLAALRALGIPLTALPKVIVFGP